MRPTINDLACAMRSHAQRGVFTGRVRAADLALEIECRQREVYEAEVHPRWAALHPFDREPTDASEVWRLKPVAWARLLVNHERVRRTFHAPRGASIEEAHKAALLSYFYGRTPSPSQYFGPGEIEKVPEVRPTRRAA